MKTLSNVNSFWEAFSEPVLATSDRGPGQELSCLCQFSGLFLYLLRVKQIEIKITNLLFIYLDLISM